jgi:hypothetical protein
MYCTQMKRPPYHKSPFLPLRVTLNTSSEALQPYSLMPAALRGDVRPQHEISLAACPATWCVQCNRRVVVAHGGAPTAQHPLESTPKMKPSTPSTRWARQRRTFATGRARILKSTYFNKISAGFRIQDQAADRTYFTIMSIQQTHTIFQEFLRKIRSVFFFYTPEESPVEFGGGAFAAMEARMRDLSSTLQRGSNDVVATQLRHTLPCHFS